MGVAADLGYAHTPPNAVQRVGQAFGSTKVGAWLFSKTLAPIDRLVFRLSKGRTSAPALLAGLPVMLVTTTGRKSGQPRTTPLIAVPVGDSLALIGTNFGQTSTPAWVFNLEAAPRLTVAYRGVELPLQVHAASEEERTDVWATASGVYGGYDKYQERISGRAIRVFVLDAVS